MLFFEALDDNEAILIEGFETFSAYAGYGRTLRYDGNLQESKKVSKSRFYFHNLRLINKLPITRGN